MADPAPVRAIVGLGNPGRRYELTRHNAGFLVADELLRRHDTGATVKFTSKFNAEFTRLTLAGREVALLKPGTFMNLSGHPTHAMCQFYGFAPDELLVVHDDLDLPWGKVQIKAGGGHGGHNGLRSLVDQLASNAFVRVRVGIGRPPGAADAADWVLQPIVGVEKAEWPDIVGRAAAAALAVVQVGVSVAMNACNGLPPRNGPRASIGAAESKDSSPAAKVGRGTVH
ncbi:MAG: aminoacyl-tRNA hydrolase [Myxococcales bacterium]|nr:aminoacyl-tRNA hydrolase [Myxococcales bacterium]